jgi:hypothetical protein
MMNEGDFESFRSLFEEFVIETLNIKKNGVPVVFPGLSTLKGFDSAVFFVFYFIQILL